MDRRGQHEGARRITCLERLKVDPVPDQGNLLCETEASDALVRLEHVADLLPSRLHQLFLHPLHDARTEARRNAETWIEIELVHPVVGVGERAAVPVREQPQRLRVPAAVERRHEHGVRVARRAGKR